MSAQEVGNYSLPKIRIRKFKILLDYQPHFHSLELRYVVAKNRGRGLQCVVSIYQDGALHVQILSLLSAQKVGDHILLSIRMKTCNYYGLGWKHVTGALNIPGRDILGFIPCVYADGGARWLKIGVCAIPPEENGNCSGPQKCTWRQSRGGGTGRGDYLLCLEIRLTMLLGPRPFESRPCQGS